MSPELIIFDCDGVLVDSEPISSRLLAEQLRALGVPLSNEEALTIFKGGKLQDAFLHAEKITGRPVPKNTEALYREKCTQAFQKELKSIAGVEAVLAKLKTKKCVASNGPREKIISNLEITKLSSFFADNIFSAYDINLWKPNPALFLWSAKKMQIAPEQCIVVEDSLHGVLAAKAAGMPVYAYAPDGGEQELANAGAKVFDKYGAVRTLAELAAFVKSDTAKKQQSRSTAILKTP